jgi:hypothetical protein
MNKVVDIFTAIILVAAIFVLVRPGSRGPQLVGSVGRAFSQMLRAATGGGEW